VTGPVAVTDLRGGELVQDHDCGPPYPFGSRLDNLDGCLVGHARRPGGDVRNRVVIGRQPVHRADHERDGLGLDFGDATVHSRIGPDRRAVFTPYRVSVRGTDFAFLTADTSKREGSSDVWSAGPTTPGMAAARTGQHGRLIAAVRAASQRDDIVIVYLHWGENLLACPMPQQQVTAQALAAAGADISVGSHAHVLLGSGWLGNTYINYGLGNFLWYHNHHPETGVLRLTVHKGHVVGDSWVPARIQRYGLPLPLSGPDRARAITDWRRLRDCTGLASGTGQELLPPYSSSQRRIGPTLRHRMRFSHHRGCPVPLTELRYLHMTYLGFDHRAHTGEMVVHGDMATDVTHVFKRLYEARWPVRWMRLVDNYSGDDDRSMAANNTSAYNCRRISGSPAWSDHAYGSAIDINPVQNPDLLGRSIRPRSGARYATVDRSGAAPAPLGVITTNSVVVGAFADFGWFWSGDWTALKDYQHFSVPER